MDRVEVLRRIDMRLKALSMSEHKAEKQAKAPSAIRNLRRGLSQPKAETINKLAKALLCPPAWLRGEDGGSEEAKSTDAPSDINKLLRERARLISQMEAIQRQIDGLDLAIQVLESPDSTPQPAKQSPRKRQRTAN